MISITLCMIVKNEQSILERCLISYAGTYDELIIVDTGSTDSTKDIAHKYTDKVYDYKWCDDFAAAMCTIKLQTHGPFCGTEAEIRRIITPA